MNRRDFFKTAGIVATTPLIATTVSEPKEKLYPFQKFQPGDKVYIDITDYNTPFGAKSMSHFKNNVVATIEYTYASHYRSLALKDDVSWKSYGLKFNDGNTSAWYYESQLTLVK